MNEKIEPQTPGLRIVGTEPQCRTIMRARGVYREIELWLRSQPTPIDIDDLREVLMNKTGVVAPHRVLIDAITFVRRTRGADEAVRSRSQYERTLRLLELFQFILPPKVKREVYEPQFNDLLEDFLIKAQKYDTKWASRWLRSCFVMRAFSTVIGSLWAALGSKVGNVFLAFLPEPLRKILGK
jgi:hypothetical protein